MTVHDHCGHEHSGPGYASPEAAREQPPEQFVYVAALYEGSGSTAPTSSRSSTWIPRACGE